MKHLLTEKQLWDLSSILHHALEFEEEEPFLEFVLLKTARALKAKSGIIAALKPEQQEISFFKQLQQGQISDVAPANLDHKLLQEIISNRTSIIHPSGDSLLGLKQGHFASAAYIPIFANQEALGILGLAGHTPGIFKPELSAGLNFIGQQLALGFMHIRLKYQRNRHQELVALSELIAMLEHSLSPGELLELVLTKLQNILKMDAGGIFLCHNSRNGFPLVVQQGLPPQLADLGKISHTHFQNDIVNVPQPVILKDLSRSNQVDELLRYSGYGGFIGLPIKSTKKNWGFVILLSKLRFAELPSQIEQRLLYAIGGGMGAALETSRLFNLLVAAKQEWENTFDSIDDLVAILDSHYRIARANKALAAKLGLHPRDIIGKFCYQQFYNRDTPCDNCPHQQALSTGKPQSGERVSPVFNGTYLITASPMIHAETVATAYVARDITRQKEMFHHLQQMQKMECIGTLTGGIAHDFNNLLDGILGYASFIKESMAPDDPLQSDVEAIEKIGRRGAELTHQLLAFAKGQKTKLGKVNLNDLIDETAGLLLRTIPKNIKLTKELESGLKFVEADSGQLQQALLNICLNARDAMPNGGQMTIQSRNIILTSDFIKHNPWALAGDYVLLSISDNGHGIDKSIQDKVFEPLFTTKTEKKYAGMGLAMVYSIIKKHQGHIQFESSAGSGTTFHIYLPVYKPSAKPAAQETILLVDNEETACQLTRNVLKNQGYQVLIAHDGKQALEIFKKYGQGIDLVILDVATPGGNEERTCQLLKGIKSNIRLLLAGEEGQGSRAGKLIDYGVQGLLQKPYQPADLISKVKLALEDK